MVERTVPHDALSPLATRTEAGGVLYRETQRAEQLADEARARAADLVAQADLIDTVYRGQFLPDAQQAIDFATALGEGRAPELNWDVQSLGEHGDNPSEALIAYAEPFVALDPSLPLPFPHIQFPTSVVLTHQGEEHRVEKYPILQPLSKYSITPDFTPTVMAPVLVDPTLRTFAELEELEAHDPGHAAQLFEAYRMAAHGLKEQGGNFRDPFVARLLLVLPTGYDYATEFLPEITPAQNDKTQAWSPYLMVRGALNESGGFIRAGISGKKRAPYNQDGKAATLRLRRPLAGDEELNASEVMPLAGHEFDHMGLILFPYTVVPAPARPHYNPSPTYSGGVTKGLNDTGASVGAADIGVGGASWASAGDKQRIGILGEQFVPTQGGRPIVYSIRVLTAQKHPDTV